MGQGGPPVNPKLGPTAGDWACSVAMIAHFSMPLHEVARSSLLAATMRVMAWLSFTLVAGGQLSTRLAGRGVALSKLSYLPWHKDWIKSILPHVRWSVVFGNCSGSAAFPFFSSFPTPDNEKSDGARAHSATVLYCLPLLISARNFPSL